MQIPYFMHTPLTCDPFSIAYRSLQSIAFDCFGGGIPVLERCLYTFNLLLLLQLYEAIAVANLKRQHH